MAFESTAVSLPYVVNGQVRGLAFTSDRHNPQRPICPPWSKRSAEFRLASFTGIVAPAGTPANIVSRLNAAINESLNRRRCSQF